jgi:hypothetical protein
MLPICAETVTQFSATHFTAHYSKKKKSWKNYRVLTLALPSSNYYMSPLSLRARISHLHFLPTLEMLVFIKFCKQIVNMHIKSEEYT